MTFHVTKVVDMMADAIHEGRRFVSSCGGTRSGKTYAALYCLYVKACKDDMAKTPTITSVVSETFPHLRRGAIRDFQTILGSSWKDERWSKTDCTYTLPNGTIIEFFSADSPAKVHGPARDRLFLNECQNIPYDIARQLFVRTRGLVLLDYNPTHQFWVMDKVEPRDECVCVHSTYKDNVDRSTGESMLSREQLLEIESNRSDSNWWTVYGEGKVGTLDGLIYDFDTIDSLPDASSLVEVQGLDFGFTNDPTARVRCLVDTKRKEIYVDERCYRTRMLNADIITDLQGDGVPRQIPIYADCAEPKTIAEIAAAGYNVRPCTKGAPVRSDKLTFQLQWMKGWKLHVTKSSLNLITELRNYTWEKDRDGKPINYPIDKFNHALDALRYAMFTHFGQDAGRGHYTIGFNGTKRLNTHR